MMTNQEQKPITNAQPTGFSGLGIFPKMVEHLSQLRFIQPTPIQHQAIPVAITGKDIIGIAQTGTGKTLAFGIPMIQRLAAMPGKKGLVVLPTRELALQVDETLQKIGRNFGVRTAVVIGGASMGLQIKHLRSNPHIIIGTPGRINDHIERKTLQLGSVEILVLDEADHMFDMGFAPQIKQILSKLKKERQTLLFSATMPNDILAMATAYMQTPLRFEIAPQGTTAEKIEHELFFVQKEQKMPLLGKLLAEYKGSVLIFSRTKHGAKKICKQLLAANIQAAEIHSNKSLNQRKAALDGFKQGKYRVLVATDIASRGIDVKGIELVINYDLPESASDYVHRIGRTARAGATGKAISFATGDQKNKVKEVERLIRMVIPVKKAEGISFIPSKTDVNYKHKPHRRFDANNRYRQPSRFGRNFAR